MIEFLSFLVFIIMFALAIHEIIRLRISTKRLATELVQAKLDASVFQSKLSEQMSTTALNENEGFVKFLTVSRDWAFDYIEKVQNSILILRNAMESGNEEQINAAYSELLLLIPEDKEDK